MLVALDLVLPVSSQHPNENTLLSKSSSALP